MDILIITPLFPHDINLSRTEKTFAIYNMVKYWQRENRIIVVRPVKKSWRKMISSQTQTYYVDQIKVIDVPYFRISWLNINFLGNIAKRIARFLIDTDFNPDVVIAHYYLSLCIGSRVSRLLNKPFIPAFHKRDANSITNGKGSYIFQTIRNANMLVYRSEAIKNRISGRLSQKGIPEYISNSGIEKSLIQDVSVFFQKAENIVNGNLLNILTVSSLIPLKNIDVVLQGLSALGSKSWTLSIIGDGPEREKLKQLVLDLGIYEQVVFHGLLTRVDVLDAMSRADIFIMASRYETFGLVYLEALARGCLVIGSRGWGIDGIVNDGVNGFLVEPGSAESITETFNRISALSLSELKIIASAAHRTISSLDEESTSTAYLSAICDIVAKNR